MLPKGVVPDLLAEADKLDQQAKKLREQAYNYAAKCTHQWDDKKGVYAPIHEKGYTIPGDAPGTMGIDHRSDFYVSAKTTPQWVRTCQKCGHAQKTQHKKMTNDVLRQEVPDFGD